jgi:Cu-Zn family superoxide dismutase
MEDNSMRNRGKCSYVALAFLVSTGCGGGNDDEPADRAESAPAETAEPRAIAFAHAEIEARSNSGIEGKARFAQYDGGRIRLQLAIDNAPSGLHAAHLHEIGDCSANDATSAGGHWNPTAAEHGAWGTEPFHLGDLGNIDVGEDGRAELEMSTDLWSLGTGDVNDIIGRAVIVHAGADDFTTQPTGGAGARIGCGVVEVVEGGDDD